MCKSKVIKSDISWKNSKSKKHDTLMAYAMFHPVQNWHQFQDGKIILTQLRNEHFV